MNARPLKIAMTADPELPVPPRLYGGIERVIHMLVRGLLKRGHEVTLFANKDSEIPCELVPYPGRSSLSKRDTFKNMKVVTRKVLNGSYDLIHSHGRLAYLLELLPRKLPKIMTYQRMIHPRSVILGKMLSRGSLYFTSVSRHLMQAVKKHASWHVIYNGVEVEKFSFATQVSADAPLVFLGRIEEVKGAHLAIEVAKKSRRKLVIAGNVEPSHQVYYDEKINPYLDGDQITYIGPVDDIKKMALLVKSAALLMPIQYEDPCPVVLSEALACGTPIIGLNRGAVPEVVEHENTGFICETTEEMVDAVKNIHAIDRVRCRRAAEERFSQDAIVSAYENLYREVVFANRN